MGRTLVVISLALLLLLCTGTQLGDLALSYLWHVINWLHDSWAGMAGRQWGWLFALVQAGHLLGLAMLGGAVILGDGRLLNLWFTDYPNIEIQKQAHRLFLWALALMAATGLFMACAVAIKLYYLEVFWAKMMTLLFGVIFALMVKWPFIKQGLTETHPRLTRALAVASLMLWFTVAATGRWIGFS